MKTEKKTTKRSPRVKRLLPFPEPPPQMDVEDPRWSGAFARWAERNAAWYGMEDAMEMFGRALGIKKSTMDGYVERQRAERRKKQKRLEDLATSGNVKRNHVHQD